MLPGLPQVISGHSERSAHQWDGDGLHQRPRGQQHQHSHNEPQHYNSHQAGAKCGHAEGKLVWCQIGHQAQVVVDMGSQGNAGTSAQDLSGVTTRGAPGVQGEGEEAQAQVEGDDDDWSVAAGQIEAIDQVQYRQEEAQDEDAVQKPSDDVLKEIQRQKL